MRLTDPSEAVRGASPKGTGFSAFGIAPDAAVSGASTRSQVLIPSLKIKDLNLDFKAARAEPSWPREGFLKNHAYNNCRR
ncbi:MAG: hypothetical protein AMJ79_00615 [Phycisphaerae bacterium SM23_30]|nr:MAG: hypothetical protein AMJ79_00615 [Phycisphaerae bacterium SM23_30]